MMSWQEWWIHFLFSTFFFMKKTGFDLLVFLFITAWFSLDTSGEATWITLIRWFVESGLFIYGIQLLHDHRPAEYSYIFWWLIIVSTLGSWSHASLLANLTMWPVLSKTATRKKKRRRKTRMAIRKLFALHARAITQCHIYHQ